MIRNEKELQQQLCQIALDHRVVPKAHSCRNRVELPYSRRSSSSSGSSSTVVAAVAVVVVVVAVVAQ